MQRQRGVALLTAVLVVALATVAAVAIATRQQLDIRRTGNLLAQDQAYLYGLAVEAYALRLLGQIDKIDKLPWQGCRSQRVPLALDDAELLVWLEDLQCRFNLNRLRPGNDEALADFVRLVTAVSAAGGQLRVDGETLGRAVQDWLDPDTDDPVYRFQSPPYLSANQPLLDAAELQLVRGVDAGTWQALAPYVTALPDAGAALRLTGASPVMRNAFGEPQPDAPASRYYRLGVQVQLGRHGLLLCSVLDVAQSRVVLRKQGPCGP
jgi:general secretion pathway protein K